MNLTRRLVISWIGMLLCLPALGRAAESADSKLVLLGVQQQGRPQPAISRAIERRLERMVEPYRLPRPALTAEERACRTLECLVSIAKAQRAERLLAADVTTPFEQLTVISVWLFDARSKQSAEEEARCERCDAGAIEEMVANSAARLLEKYPASTPLSTSVTPIALAAPLPGTQINPAPPPAANSQGQDPLAQKRQARIVAASVIGTLLGVMIVTSVALTVVDKSGDSLCRLTMDFQQRGCASLPGVYGAGYGLSAALTGGLVLSLALPLK